MKFISFATAALAFGLSVFATTTVQSVTYDATYDESSLSLNDVACSDGANGLVTKGYTTLGSLPNFPKLGGAYTVSWNSPNCGACYQLTYGTTTIAILAVDYAEEGFNISEEAMNALTGGVGIDVGKVYVNATQVDASVCGL